MRKTLQQKFLEILRENPGVSLKDATRMLNTDVNTLKKTAYRLRSLGYVERAGNAYILTERGSKYLEYLERVNVSLAGDERREEVEKISPKTTPSNLFVIKENSRNEVERADKGTEEERREDVLNSLRNLIEKLTNLEERVKDLEESIKSIEKAIESLRGKKQEKRNLEHPVMLYNDAVSKYGAVVDRLLAENRLLRIGSLVVDMGFYSDFKSRFPIKVADVDKLSQYHRVLLEEMRKEALVILHGGKEYRLVE
ncbi:MAG: hypothetical protein QXK88_00525 [Desulfurococcaceae archaeon]